MISVSLHQSQAAWSSRAQEIVANSIASEIRNIMGLAFIFIYNILLNLHKIL